MLSLGGCLSGCLSLSLCLSLSVYSDEDTRKYRPSSRANAFGTYGDCGVFACEFKDMG